MGVDVHGFNFLRLAARQAPLGRTATIGRQVVDTPAAVVRRAFPDRATAYEGYCEAMLTDLFGATAVESFDNSDYEGATHVADFNKPVTAPEPYDTVIDFGCLEHVFDVRQAFANCAALCRDGGRILHLLPANNYCGHGFWQFSPELFFSLYGEANGFSDTRVFLADLSREDRWLEVKRPEPGVRVNVTSSGPVYVLAITRKLRPVGEVTVQQSDYVHVWEAADQAPAPAAPARRPQPEIVRAARRALKALKVKNRAAASHPHLVERRLAALLG